MPERVAPSEKRIVLAIALNDAVNDAYKEYERARERLQLALTLLNQKEFRTYAKRTQFPNV